jgi:hypothetical protein
MGGLSPSRPVRASVACPSTLGASAPGRGPVMIGSFIRSPSGPTFRQLSGGANALVRSKQCVPSLAAHPKFPGRVTR